MDSSSYDYMVNLHSKFTLNADNLINLSTLYLSDNQTAVFALKSLDLLYRSASNFFEEDNFLSGALHFIILSMTNYPSVVLSNINTYFNLLDSFITNSLIQINKMKVLNSISNSTLRNSSLTGSQEATFNNTFKKIQNGLFDLITFYSQNSQNFSTPVTYDTNNINILLYGINETFRFSTISSIYKPLYYPYFEMDDCLSFIMKNKYSRTSYKIWMNYNIWKTVPYLYSKELYENITSPMIDINFIDPITGSQFIFDNCMSYPISHYFPVNNMYLVPFINYKRSMLDPSTQYNVNSSIFNMPIYIAPSGQVTNDTVNQRIDKYFINYNFTCKFFNISTNKFDDLGMSYYNFSLNYYNCKSSHLTSFIVDFFQILPIFQIYGRFYYVPHYELFFYSGNYSNYGLSIMIIIFFLYCFVALIYSFCDNYVVTRLGLLDYLKIQIIKINIPYSRDYNFNLNMLIESEAITRINKGSNKTEKKNKAQVNIVDYNENNNKILEEFKAPNYEVIILKDNEFLNNELNKYSKPLNKIHNTEIISPGPMPIDELIKPTNVKDQFLFDAVKDTNKSHSIDKKEPDLESKANLILANSKFKKNKEEYSDSINQMENNILPFKKEIGHMKTDSIHTYNKIFLNQEKENHKEIQRNNFIIKKEQNIQFVGQETENNIEDDSIFNR